MPSLFDLVFALCAFFVLGLFYYCGAIPHILAPLGLLFNLVWTIVVYTFNVLCFLFYAAFALVFLFIICNFIYSITGHSFPPDKNPFYSRPEKAIKVQIAAIHKQQRKTSRAIEKLIPQIERYNAANEVVMRDIRSAEILLKKRVPGYEPQTDRPRFRLTGVQFRPQPTFEEQQAEANYPSVWAFVRWWKGQDEAPVFEAWRELNRLGRVHKMKESAFEYLQDEHGTLHARLREVKGKREAAWLMPEPVKRPAGSRLGGLNMARPYAQPVPVVYQKPIESRFTRRQKEVEENRGQIMHICNYCDQRHFWIHQYPNKGAALAAPTHLPCAAAAGRLERMRITFGLAPPPAPPAPAPMIAPFVTTPSYYTPPVGTPTQQQQQQQQQTFLAPAPAPTPTLRPTFFPTAAVPQQLPLPTLPAAPAAPRLETPAPAPAPAVSRPTTPVVIPRTPSPPPSPAPAVSRPTTPVVIPRTPSPPPSPAPAAAAAAAPPPAPRPALARLPTQILYPIITNSPAPMPEPEPTKPKSLFERMTFGPDGQPLRAPMPEETKETGGGGGGGGGGRLRSNALSRGDMPQHWAKRQTREEFGEDLGERTGYRARF